MKELDWLKEKSGLSDEKLKEFEALTTRAEFTAMLQSIISSNEAAEKARQDAETARLNFESRYSDEFVPEMRRIVTENIATKGELARLKAENQTAREYGIVIDPPPANNAPPNPEAPPRAPGSPAPDPNLMSRDEFGRFSNAQSAALIAVTDLMADHQRLFKEPLSGLQELTEEVAKQRKLGNGAFTLRQAWEQKHNVAEKRAEIQKAERQKEIDTAIAADRKEQAQKFGANPNLRSGVQSRFSSYKPAANGQEPWKASKSNFERNRGWREKAVAKISEHIAA